MPAWPQELHLTVNRRNQPPVRMVFSDDRITLGRSTSCSVPIPDPFLSREHAEIRRAGDQWVLSDKGSVNGTFHNGSRVLDPVPLKPGDRVTLGDAEVHIEKDGAPKQESAITINDQPSVSSVSLPMIELTADPRKGPAEPERLDILNRLALEFLEDRPMNELFDFIVSRVLDHLAPSRAALGILNETREAFSDVRVRCQDESDTSVLAISQTLLREVVDKRRVVSYTDVSASERLAQARSIIGQDIRSALCAPLIVEDQVMGVLYIDYVITQRSITEADIKLMAKIAGIAARKLETTHLREKALEKQKLDEELKTAFLIQSRLLPTEPPKPEGFRFEGFYRPCRTVSGDYYDFVERPDGRVYFIIADVSGKGLTAALVMAGVAAAFNTLTNYDPLPSQILSDLNRTLTRKTDPSMFVTGFCGLIDPKKGEIVFANGGHNPPYVCAVDGTVRRLESRTGLALGVFADFVYADETLQLDPGSMLYLYTDGITEAANSSEQLFTDERLQASLEKSAGPDPRAVGLATLAAVDEFVKEATQADDMTIVCVQRL